MSQNDKDNKQLSWSNPQNSQQPNAPKSAPAAAPKPATPAPQKNSSAKSGDSGSTARMVGWIAGGVVVGVLIAWGATSLYKHTGTGDTTAGSLESATSTASGTGSTQEGSLVSVASPQKAGLEVAVSGVTVNEPTWVVVYESRNGTPGNVLGASLFFAGGTSGTIELLRSTVAGQTYFVTERTDNGDHKFSLKDDQLVLVGGQPAWTTFTAN